MKKTLLLLVLLCAGHSLAFGTDIQIQSSVIPNANFANLGSDITGTCSVTNSSLIVTSSAGFRSAWVGLGGFQIAINGVRYTVAGVTSTSSLTLTTVYTGLTSSSASFMAYRYALLRIFALNRFTPNGASYVVPASDPNSGQFFKQVACSVVSDGTTTSLYIPSLTLPATTDATNPEERDARYFAGFYTPGGAQIRAYDCFESFKLSSSPSSTTWTALCTAQSPGGSPPVEYSGYVKSQVYNKGEINALLAGVGGGAPGGSSGAIQINNSGAFGGLTLGSQLANIGGTLKGSGIQGAINAVVDFNAVGDGVANDTTPIANALVAAAAAGGKKVYLPAGTYKVTSTLNVPGGVVLEGDGMNKTIISSTANAVIVNGTGGTGAYLYIGPTIRNLRIVGSKTAGSSQIGLRIDALPADPYYAQATVEHVSINQSGSHGLYVGNAFSSRFVDIYSDDNAGYPFLINSASMPGNHFESLYAQAVNASANVGFRIRAGSFVCHTCNGINNSAPGSWNAVVGDKVGVDGATANVMAYAEWHNSNFESARAGGVNHYWNSRSNFIGENSFGGDGSASGSYIAIRYEVVRQDPPGTDLFYPEYGATGEINENVIFANTPASFYASSTPIQANDLPPLVVTGKGPKIAGGGTSQQWGYYNTTRAQTEPLRRSGDLAHIQAVTATGNVYFGTKLVEATCASNCTITLPWPGWYEPSEPVIVKNLSTTGVVVTINAASGGGVNGGGSYTMSASGDSVTFRASNAALDWRVINSTGAASLASSRVGFGSAGNALTGSSSLAWDDSLKILTLSGAASNAHVLVSDTTNSISVRLGTLSGAPDRGIVGTVTNKPFVLYANGNAAVGIDNSTLAFIPFATSNTIDLGSSSAYYKSAYVQTSILLGVGGSTTGALTLRNSTNSNTFTLRAGATGSNLTFTLPTADGTSGQVLITNGAGVLSFASGGGSPGLTVGTSTITSGTTTRVLYDNAGVVGEYTISGTGDVAMTTSPVFTAPALGTPSVAVLTNATGLPLTTGVAGTLPVANGGSGATTLTGVLIGNGTSAFTVKANPSGAFVGDTDTQTLSSKTLTTPTIAATGWSNANHAHDAANSGGQLNAATAFNAGSLPLDRGGTNATSANFSTNGSVYYNGTRLLSTAAGGAGTLCLVATDGGVPSFGSCSGSSSTAWSSLTAPTGALALNMAAQNSTFTWGAATSGNMFTLRDTSSNSGTGYVLLVNTAASSAAKPISITAGGTANGVEMSTAGSLGAIGSGGIVATTGDSATAFFPAGTMEVVRGGTGLASGTSGGVLAYTASGTLASSGALGAGDIVIGGGAGATPTSLTAGATTTVLVGGGAGTAPVWTTATGTGAPVRAGAPTFTSSINLGTPSSVAGSLIFANATNANLVTITSLSTANVALSLPATSSDTLVARNTTDTLTNKTLTTPTIADFTNATHNHSNAAGGGTLAFGTAVTNLSGDVTTSGSSVSTLANIPSAVPMAGSLLATAIAAPATPAAGKASIYVDSTSKNLAAKNDAGTVNHGVQTRAASSAVWIRSIADDGSTTVSQPAFSDISGTATLGQLPVIAISDLGSSTANTTFAQTTFNTTIGATTGLFALSWSGGTGTNSAFKVSSTNTSATGYIFDVIADSTTSVLKPIRIQAKQTDVLTTDAFGAFSFSTKLRTSGTPTFHTRFVTPADTGLTASTESIGMQFGGNTSAATVSRQFTNGALTTQRENLFVAPTYAFNSASTLTTAINADFADPIAGANATLTNSYSIRGANVLFTGLIKAGSTPTTLTDSAGKILSAALNTVAVGQGGTGATTLTSHGLIYGNGTSAVGILAEASNGQIPIGSTGNVPVLAALTGTSNQVVVTNGAGSVTLSLPQSIATSSTPQFGGLGIGAAAPVNGIGITTTAAAGTLGLTTALTQNTRSTVTEGRGLDNVYTLSASSASDQGVVRVFNTAFTNSLTGGGHIQNARMFSFTGVNSTGAVIDNLAYIFLEESNSGTITTKYAIDDQTGGAWYQHFGNVGIQAAPNSTNILDIGGSVHATAFNVSSDRRLKTNIKPISGAMAKLRAVNGITFEWDDIYPYVDKYKNRGGNKIRQMGLIAQDVEAVLPELVTQWQAKKERVDENGKPLRDAAGGYIFDTVLSDARSVDYGRFTAVVVEGLKEVDGQLSAVSVKSGAGPLQYTPVVDSKATPGAPAACQRRGTAMLDSTDVLWICTAPGAAGVAVWKKTALLP